MRGAPISKNSLESPFGKGGRVARQVQQDAAGVRGVPEIPVFSIPQEWGPATVLSVKVFGVFR